MIITESSSAGWLYKDHLERKNADGVCGLDVLRDNGIEYVVDRPGDLTLVTNGDAQRPRETVCITLEGPLTYPEYYRHDIFKPFAGRLIYIDVSDPIYVDRVCGKGASSLKNLSRGQICGMYDYKTGRTKEKKLVVFTSMHNFPNRYTSEFGVCHMRKIMITKAAERYGDDFDFFGKYSDGSTPNYRGSHYEAGRRYDYPKIDMIANYKFVFCLENCAFNGYITEKIQHALIARTIPIYLGAPDIVDYVPKELFINVGDFETIDECLDHVDSLSEREIADRISMIDDFCNDPKLTIKLDSVGFGQKLATFLKGL